MLAIAVVPVKWSSRSRGEQIRSSSTLKKENLGPLLNGVCDLMTMNTLTADNAFFASVFTNKIFQASELCKSIQRELPAVDKDEVKITCENLTCRNPWNATDCIQGC